MSAETLRRAAALMREDAPSLDDDRAWHPVVALAVADWLEDEAEWIEAGSTPGGPGLDVALAYLGEST